MVYSNLWHFCKCTLTHIYISPCKSRLSQYVCVWFLCFDSFASSVTHIWRTPKSREQTIIHISARVQAWTSFGGAWFFFLLFGCGVVGTPCCCRARQTQTHILHDETRLMVVHTASANKRNLYTSTLVCKAIIAVIGFLVHIHKHSSPTLPSARVQNSGGANTFESKDRLANRYTAKPISYMCCVSIVPGTLQLYEQKSSFMGCWVKGASVSFIYFIKANKIKNKQNTKKNN